MELAAGLPAAASAGMSLTGEGTGVGAVLGSGSGATARSGAGIMMGGTGGTGGSGREARLALLAAEVTSCTLSASKSMAAVISTPFAVRRVARITASAPRLSRTARNACLMSGPVWRVIFISVLQLPRAYSSSADRRYQADFAVIRYLAPGQNVHVRDTGADEPGQRLSQRRRHQQHRRLADQFLTLRAFRQAALQSLRQARFQTRCRRIGAADGTLQ